MAVWPLALLLALALLACNFGGLPGRTTPGASQPAQAPATDAGKPAPTAPVNSSAFTGGITARAGYDLALPKAQAWNPAANLISVHVKYAKPDSSGLNGGVANSWEYKFIALPEPKGVENQPEFDAVVGSAGVIDYRVMPENTGHTVIGSQADWLIDSDAVFSLAEINGGKDFRDRHPDAKYDLWLDLAFSQVDTLTTSHNVRWTASYYLENDPATHLVVQVDGTTGLLAPRP